MRQGELAQVRLEAAAVRRAEVDAARRELAAEHAARLADAAEGARAAERRLTERLRAVEAAEFESRQRLLAEMDALRAREQVGACSSQECLKCCWRVCDILPQVSCANNICKVHPIMAGSLRTCMDL